MDTLSFLQRVLPTEGLFCVAAFEDGHPAPRHGFFNTVEELAKVSLALNSRGQNTYYAISTYAQKKRKQEFVQLTKVLAIDVDCGIGKNGKPKPYPNASEGARALVKFTQDVGLPLPMIVSSGNGLHAYWVLDKAVAPAQWKPLAEAMKAACVAKDFTPDIGVSGDSARVLRALGCTNPRGGKTATLLRDAPDVSYDHLWSTLSPYTTSSSYEPPPQHTRSSGLLDSLAVKHEYAPAKADKIESSCQQIKWAVENQADVPEPMWYGLIGVAAYCEDSDAVAIRWSEHHPKFDHNETLRKLHQWKQQVSGPTSCEKFAVERPGGCRGCKFSGKIHGPARLGTQLAEVKTRAVAIDPLATTIDMPKPFKRTTAGIKMVIDETDIDVCKFDIYPIGYGKDEGLGYEVVRFMWERPHVGWTELVIRQAHMTDGSREFSTAIADQGIVLFNKNQTNFFQMLLRSYMEELKQKRGLTNLYASMGWKDNYSQFVLGNHLLRRDSSGNVTQEAVNLASSINRIGEEMYGTKGSMAEFVKFTGILQKADLKLHKFLIGLSLATPLLKLTGLKGLTVSLYGDTGGGKTLGQLMQQAVWGNPDQLHFGGKFTQNSMFSRLATHGNLPMTVDELTMLSKEDAGDLLYWASQGKDKARLSRTAEERMAKEWQTTLTVSTNQSIQSMLYAGGKTSDAQLARLIEFNVRPHPLFVQNTNIGRQMHTFLMNNYGLIGPVFIKHIMEMGPDAVKAMIDHAIAEFPNRYGVKFSGEERFWEVCVVLADLGNSIGKDLGLLDYEYEDATAWAVEELGGMKKAVASNRVDAFDMLGEFINEHASGLLTVMHTPNQKAMRDNNNPYINDLVARYDLYRKSFDGKFETGTLLIERTKLRKWLARRGADYKAFLREFEEEHIIATPKSQKAYMGKDVGIKIPQCYVVGINLNHPRLQGVLDDAFQAVADQTLGQLQAVG
jgi:hypothetical protein